MEKAELNFLRITYSHTQAGAYVLILAEKTGDRRLPIIIGGVEAQAIAIQVENIKPARPLTHDLFKDLADKASITLKEVVINDLVEGIFHAKLVLEQELGDEIEVDARSSDAIALALRFECPIYTYEFILAAAGLRMDDVDEEGGATPATEGKLPMPKKDIRTASPEDLKNLLQEALEQEDYERASNLRDELKRREGIN